MQSSAAQDDREYDLIDVHFDGCAWRVDDTTLDEPLEFSRLADAEARASQLSRLTGRTVCVHGQKGELIDTFGEPFAAGYMDDTSMRFSLLELW